MSSQSQWYYILSIPRVAPIFCVYQQKNGDSSHEDNPTSVKPTSLQEERLKVRVSPESFSVRVPPCVSVNLSDRDHRSWLKCHRRKLVLLQKVWESENWIESW
ncbi:uncharacterized protein LOC129322241 [Prosopis cineraria]|uniref:uncharacterized protein LOC129322241 n=1 Tax=Prosopis cineraria TaxID=364024 RepID=UPI0024107B33|nr:uncharacterized protein LOC129322241 [Prosopis cineraria]